MTTPTDVNIVLPFGYGRGYPTFHPSGNPGAGNGDVIPVPGSRNYRIISVNATFTTSAVVAARTPIMEWRNGDGVFTALAPASASVAASTTTTVQFTLGIGTAYTAGSGALVVPLPELITIAGHSIVLTALNIDAGDAFTNIHWYWEEFPVGGQGYPVGVQPQFPAYALP